MPIIPNKQIPKISDKIYEDISTTDGVLEIEATEAEIASLKKGTAIRVIPKKISDGNAITLSIGSNSYNIKTDANEDPASNQIKPDLLITLTLDIDTNGDEYFVLRNSENNFSFLNGQPILPSEPQPGTGLKIIGSPSVFNNSESTQYNFNQYTMISLETQPPENTVIEYCLVRVLDSCVVGDDYNIGVMEINKDGIITSKYSNSYTCKENDVGTKFVLIDNITFRGDTKLVGFSSTDKVLTNMGNYNPKKLEVQGVELNGVRAQGALLTSNDIGNHFKMGKNLTDTISGRHKLSEEGARMLQVLLVVRDTVETFVDYFAIPERSTIHTLTSKNYDTTDIENTFYVDSVKGIGWGTNDNTYKTLEIPVPANATEFSLVFSGSENVPVIGLGYLDIRDKDNNSLFSFTDGHSNSNSNQTIYINGNKVTGNFYDVENKEVTVETQGATSIFVKMKGYTSSYAYTKRYIKSLIFN